jgi:hypothetical protein
LRGRPEEGGSPGLDRGDREGGIPTDDRGECPPMRQQTSEYCPNCGPNWARTSPPGPPGPQATQDQQVFLEAPNGPCARGGVVHKEGTGSKGTQDAYTGTCRTEWPCRDHKTREPALAPPLPRASANQEERAPLRPKDLEGNGLLLAASGLEANGRVLAQGHPEEGG